MIERPHRPPDGASAERTRLAWRRTGLAMTAVAFLAIRLAVRDGADAATGIGIAASAIGWLAATWYAQRRIHAMTDKQPRHVGRSLPAIALATVWFAVLGIALVLARG